MSEIRFIVQRDITLKIMVFLTGVTGSLVSALKRLLADAALYSYTGYI